MQCFSGVFKVADIYLKAPNRNSFFFGAARRVTSAEGASYLGRTENRGKKIEHLEKLFPVESVCQARLEFTQIVINNE